MMFVGKPIALSVAGVAEKKQAIARQLKELSQAGPFGKRQRSKL
jgi:hypothetical protein